MHMPVVTAVANAVTKPLPRLMSPKAHAVADYLVIGTMLIAGALFWRRNRRAAVGALVCGGVELTANLLTDYPGGVSRVVSYPAHGKIDIGIAAMMATMPEFLGLHDAHEKKLFIGGAAAVTAVANLTDFSPSPRLQARRWTGTYS
jgi:hypothetical protein